MRVHASNFKMLGFTSSVDIVELVELARRNQPPVYVLDDLGSGALLDTASYGLSHEPMPQESIRAGATVAVFSADKLLGGPQAGIMIGTREAIERCRVHPLARALRADKYTLAALGATVLHYLRGEAEREIPVWRMIAMPKNEIRRRAEYCQHALQGWADRNALRMELVDGESTIGGGSLPGEVLPTVLLALRGAAPDQLAADLRQTPVPVITRIRDDCVLLDLRTVLDDQQMIDSVGRR
jgi:L-seryl-tRNA(Ser) seleniumtransferase